MDSLFYMAFSFSELFSGSIDEKYINALLIFAIGFPIVLIFSAIAKRIIGKNFSAHFALLAHKSILYIGLTVLILMILVELDIEISALLGTAGLLTIAFSFAAKTSLSNLISGLFLLGEKPFQIGDLVEINKVRGYVISIDILSVKLRTRDNLYVRVPNESIVITDVINHTRFPIRRLDLVIPVSREHDVARVLDVLHDIARKDPHTLNEPQPYIVLEGFGDNSMLFKFGTWCKTTEYFEYSSHMLHLIKDRFDKDGIQIPYPHVVLHGLPKSGVAAVAGE